MQYLQNYVHIILKGIVSLNSFRTNLSETIFLWFLSFSMQQNDGVNNTYIIKFNKVQFSRNKVVRESLDRFLKSDEILEILCKMKLSV